MLVRTSISLSQWFNESIIYFSLIKWTFRNIDMVKISKRGHAVSGNGNKAGRIYADFPKGIRKWKWLLVLAESIPGDFFSGLVEKGYGYFVSNLMHSLFCRIFYDFVGVFCPEAVACLYFLCILIIRAEKVKHIIRKLKIIYNFRTNTCDFSHEIQSFLHIYFTNCYNIS